MDFSFRPFEIVSLIAILIGPILAILVSKVLEYSRNSKERKEYIFRILMANRGATVKPNVVDALNLIEITFTGQRDKDVQDAWKYYLAHLNNHSLIKADNAKWVHTREERFTDLLHKISKSLRYNVDRASIESGGYVPQHFVDTENDAVQIKNGLIKIISGNAAIKVKICKDDGENI
ncbi:MAG: hypothetical protein KKF77_02250 [Proteobacteria bacterium]|nr:hypothetical protein [Pseudomonadota bacterium]